MMTGSVYGPQYRQARTARDIGMKKTQSSRDRLEGALVRIADPKGEGARACLTVYAEAARARPMPPMRGRAGVSLGPLDGAIVTIKDLFDVAGEKTRAGSKVLAEEAQAGRSRCRDRAAASRRRGGDRRQDQYDRVRLFRDRRQSAFRHALQSGRPHAHSRRLVVGRGGRRGDGMCEIAIGSDTGARCGFPPRSAASSASSRPDTGFPTDGAFPLSFSLDSVGPLARRSRIALIPTP